MGARGGERTGDAAATAEVSIGGRGGDRDRGRRQVRESCGEASGAGARGHHIVVHAMYNGCFKKCLTIKNQFIF